MNVFDKDNFEAEVVNSDLPVVVDIWGPQCGPCLALLPEIEKMAEEFEGKVKFGKLNAAENRRFLMGLKVMALPTFLFYKGGEQVSRISGADVTGDSVRAAANGLL